MLRKIPLETGEVYHVFNKSIARYVIFNDENEYWRMLELINYYQYADVPCSFSRFISLEYLQSLETNRAINSFFQKYSKLVDIIAYCLMPTHFHLVLRQESDQGISQFMRNIQNGYSLYFNRRRNRKGPLWVGVFKNVLVESDEQLLHLTRYVHLNPTTAYLAKDPIEWHYSSYQEYLSGRWNIVSKGVDDLIELDEVNYKRFVEEYRGDQQNLACIKKLILE